MWTIEKDPLVQWLNEEQWWHLLLIAIDCNGNNYGSDREGGINDVFSRVDTDVS